MERIKKLRVQYEEGEHVGGPMYPDSKETDLPTLPTDQPTRPTEPTYLPTHQPTEPAAKPECHLGTDFPTNTPGTTPSHRASFSGARAGSDKPFVDFEPEFNLKDKLKAQLALEAILGRNKKAIGGMVWPGLEIAKKIIDSLLA
jgi:hypothetical protein